MEFPVPLRAAIEEKITSIRQEQLKKTAAVISERYRNDSGAGKRLVSTDVEALVYSLVRMPATFGAVADVFGYLAESCDESFNSVLDAGAGTGAASWAANAVLGAKEYTCLEREIEMRELGKSLMTNASAALASAKWLSCDLIKDAIPHADLVVVSYVLSEMNASDREKVLEKLWNSADRALVIVEPGTPVAYAQLIKARDVLLSRGAHIAAPCPHEAKCRLDDTDWCHFTTRIQRSKLHKLLKDGEAPYEDEKYSYMAFTRVKPHTANSRVLRHPITEKAQVTLELCTSYENTRLTVRKSDARYKEAKKVDCGDYFGGKE